MSKNLIWYQSGGCGGDTLSLLNMESPTLCSLLDELAINVLWHPTMSATPPGDEFALFDDIANGTVPLDILCVEGSVMSGPENTGMFCQTMRRPAREIVLNLARKAQYVVAVGTCASFGGPDGACSNESQGLQYKQKTFGGVLGENFVSGSGLPVINLPGCPCHPAPVRDTLTAICTNIPITLTFYNTPSDWYGLTVHQGCTRNEYHEYKVEDNVFGERGCLFFHKGCKGPMTWSHCNKVLWNQRNSKPRAGVPCMGCTSPDFPREQAFFNTPNIEGVPLELPIGVDRAHYLAYKDIAAAAAPSRLTDRKTRV